MLTSSHRTVQFAHSNRSFIKRFLFVVGLLCAMPTWLLAQYTGVVTGPPTQYLYVGSLTKSETDLGNGDKLKVDVFGGGWESDDLGQTSFYIANRSGLIVHETVIGGSNNNNFTLLAYDNGTNNIDFYISTRVGGFTAISVSAVILAHSATPVSQNVTVTSSSSTPAGTLHALTIVPVIITDEFGNMAFGTNTIDTDYKLSVGGGLRATKVVIDAGWADYVFDKDYHLMPLEKVADYVHVNHHLPDVPSTAQVSARGANVGETETLLLKKVEELTLYLIQKDKEIALQKRIAQRQKQQINSVLKRLNKLDHQKAAQ